MSLSNSIAAPAETVPWRALFLLGSASFAASAGLRFCDPLLPILAKTFDTTPGAASIIVTAYAVAYGSFQLVTGPLGDRYGKVLTVAVGTTLSGLFTFACAFATSLPQIALLRLLAGLGGAAIIANCIAFIGDTIPLAQRSAVMARYLIFMSSGAIGGQAVGGLLADIVGWHATFMMVGGFLIAAGSVLLVQLRTNPVLSRRPSKRPERWSDSFRQMRDSGRTPLGRLVLTVVTLEAFIYFGAFTFVGAHLHQRFDANFTVVGLMTALAAIGAVAYSSFAPYLIARFSRQGLAALAAAAFFISFILIALSPSLVMAGVAIGMCGAAFALFHNMLQTMATQINPDARGAAIAAFAFCLYAGQTVGVLMAGAVFDRFGAGLIFVAAAAMLPCLAAWFRARLPAVEALQDETVRRATGSN